MTALTTLHVNGDGVDNSACELATTLITLKSFFAVGLHVTGDGVTESACNW